MRVAAHGKRQGELKEHRQNYTILSVINHPEEAAVDKKTTNLRAPLENKFGLFA
jgi:hypothetical protein